ncbi:MAG: Rieske 2Fe-2S domain-containing protein [Vulcanimicrobiota bacterium]
MSSFPDGGRASEQPRWRRDFPIDWPEDQLVSRRNLLRFMVVVSTGFAAGQFWIGGLALKKRGEKHPRVEVARADQLGVGESLVFSYPEEHDRCLLVRTSQDEYVAFSQKCTHLACAVVPEPDKNRFHCPCHAGYFDIKTGRPLAGPPRRPLPKIELEFDNNTIYAVGVIKEMT